MMNPIRRNIRFTAGWMLAITLAMVGFLALNGVAPTQIALLAALMIATTLVLSLVLYGYRGYMQRLAFEGKKSASDDQSSEQEKTVEIDLPYDAAFMLALDALQTLDSQALPQPDHPMLKSLLPKTQHLTIRDANPESGIIEAGLKVHTMGIPDGLADFSRITVRLERLKNNTTRLTIRSVPNLVSEAYDMGKNLHYVNGIALYLRRESQVVGAADRLSETDFSAEAPETQAGVADAAYRTR